MAQVLIRNLPEDVVAALKRRAGRCARSLEAELRLILTDAAHPDQQPMPQPPLQLNLSTATPRSSWRRERIYGDDER